MLPRNIKDLERIIENNEKEKWLRVLWNEKHREDVQKAATLHREPTNYTTSDIQESVMSAGMATISRANIVAAGYRKTKWPEDYEFVKMGKVKELEPCMKSVPDETKELLNKGGRIAYLKKRNLLEPNKKYNFMECESWKYGWEFGLSENRLTCPVHGKIFHMRRIPALGPQPDPSHYRDCQASTSLCTHVN